MPIRRDLKDRRADTVRHFIVKTVHLLDGKDAFLEDLNERIDVSNAKEVFFIQGHDNTFQDALGRTAQHASDLEIDGAAIAYSWPSRGSFLSYIVDRNQKIDPFVDDLAGLLAAIAQRSGARPREGTPSAAFPPN